MIDLEAINRAERLALRTDGVVVPITALFDHEGDETQNLDEAVSFVAGSDDLWFGAAFSDFAESVTQ